MRLIYNTPVWPTMLTMSIASILMLYGLCINISSRSIFQNIAHSHVSSTCMKTDFQVACLLFGKSFSLYSGL